MTSMADYRYVAITPVRDEAEYVVKTIDSMAAQTILPQKWVIVDDGSSDRTSEILDAATRKYPWIEVIHLPNRGFRKSGGGVVEAFYSGYSKIGGANWDFIVKLDGDLSFPSDYFERCLSCFISDKRLGIGGGTVCSTQNGNLAVDSPGDPLFHVRGATKIYHRACWEVIGPLVKAPGWDTIDEVRANMLGWTTRTFRDIKLIQHKETGSADGTWRNWVKNGLANYVTGYHPVFMVLKCCKRVFEPPYLVGAAGLLTGYLSGYARGIAQVSDEPFIKYIRGQQLSRLLGRDSLWT